MFRNLDRQDSTGSALGITNSKISDDIRAAKFNVDEYRKEHFPAYTSILFLRALFESFDESNDCKKFANIVLNDQSHNGRLLNDEPERHVFVTICKKRNGRIARVLTKRWKDNHTSFFAAKRVALKQAFESDTTDGLKFLIGVLHADIFLIPGTGHLKESQKKKCSILREVLHKPAHFNLLFDFWVQTASKQKSSKSSNNNHKISFDSDLLDLLVLSSILSHGTSEHKATAKETFDKLISSVNYELGHVIKKKWSDGTTVDHAAHLATIKELEAINASKPGAAADKDGLNNTQILDHAMKHVKASHPDTVDFVKYLIKETDADVKLVKNCYETACEKNLVELAKLIDDNWKSTYTSDPEDLRKAKRNALFLACKSSNVEHMVTMIELLKQDIFGLIDDKSKSNIKMRTLNEATTKSVFKECFQQADVFACIVKYYVESKTSSNPEYDVTKDTILKSLFTEALSKGHDKIVEVMLTYLHFDIGHTTFDSEIGDNSKDSISATVTELLKNYNADTSRVVSMVPDSQKDSIKEVKMDEATTAAAHVATEEQLLDYGEFFEACTNKSYKKVVAISRLQNFDINFVHAEDKMFALLIAIRNNDILLVDYFLKMPNVDLSLRDKDGFTCLELACKKKRTAIASRILHHYRHVARVDISDISNPLFAAVKEGKDDVTKSYIKAYSHDIFNIFGAPNCALLLLACQTIHVETFSLLLKEWIAFNKKRNATLEPKKRYVIETDPLILECLEVICTKKNMSLVNAFINSIPNIDMENFARPAYKLPADVDPEHKIHLGSFLNSVDRRNKVLQVPLSVAVKVKNTALIRTLLRKYRHSQSIVMASFKEACMLRGDIPDHVLYQIDKRQYKVFDSNDKAYIIHYLDKFLLKLDRTANLASTFIFACGFGDLQIVKMLVIKRMRDYEREKFHFLNDFLNKKDQVGHGPIHMACKNGHYNVFRYLANMTEITLNDTSDTIDPHHQDLEETRDAMLRSSEFAETNAANDPYIKQLVEQQRLKEAQRQQQQEGNNNNSGYINKQESFASSVEVHLPPKHQETMALIDEIYGDHNHDHDNESANSYTENIMPHGGSGDNNKGTGSEPKVFNLVSGAVSRVIGNMGTEHDDDEEGKEDEEDNDEDDDEEDDIGPVDDIVDHDSDFDESHRDRDRSTLSRSVKTVTVKNIGNILLASKDVFENTLLMVACFKGNIEIVELILETYQVNYGQKQSHRSILAIVCAMGRYEIAENMIEGTHLFKVAEFLDNSTFFELSKQLEISEKENLLIVACSSKSIDANKVVYAIFKRIDITPDKDEKKNTNTDDNNLDDEDDGRLVNALMEIEHASSEEESDRIRSRSRSSSSHSAGRRSLRQSISRKKLKEMKDGDSVGAQIYDNCQAFIGALYEIRENRQNASHQAGGDISDMDLLKKQSTLEIERKMSQPIMDQVIQENQFARSGDSYLHMWIYFLLTMVAINGNYVTVKALLRMLKSNRKYIIKGRVYFQMLFQVLIVACIYGNEKVVTELINCQASAFQSCPIEITDRESLSKTKRNLIVSLLLKHGYYNFAKVDIQLLQEANANKQKGTRASRAFTQKPKAQQVTEFFDRMEASASSSKVSKSTGACPIDIAFFLRVQNNLLHLHPHEKLNYMRCVNIFYLSSYYIREETFGTYLEKFLVGESGAFTTKESLNKDFVLNLLHLISEIRLGLKLRPDQVATEFEQRALDVMKATMKSVCMFDRRHLSAAVFDNLKSEYMFSNEDLPILYSYNHQIFEFLSSVPIVNILNNNFYYPLLPVYKTGTKKEAEDTSTTINKPIKDYIMDSYQQCIRIQKYFRYTPCNLVLLEGFCRMCTIGLISWVVAKTATREFDGYADNIRFSEVLLMIQLWLEILYEIGQLERNKYNLVKYFYCDFWNAFDFSGSLLLLMWFCTRCGGNYYNYTHSFSTFVLAIATIPWSVGLLRYLLVSKELGKLVMMVFAMMPEIGMFLLIFIIACFGFGVFFFGFYRDEYSFHSINQTLLTLFSTAVGNFDFTIFSPQDTNYIGHQDPSGNINLHGTDDHNDVGFKGIGQVVLCVFIIWSLVLLLNLVVARLTAIHDKLKDEAENHYAYNLTKNCQQYLIITESNSFSMLPPPLNLIPIITAPYHNYVISRAKKDHDQHSRQGDSRKRYEVQSFNGVLCDRVMNIAIGICLIPFYYITIPVVVCMIVLRGVNNSKQIQKKFEGPKTWAQFWKKFQHYGSRILRHGADVAVLPFKIFYNGFLEGNEKYSRDDWCILDLRHKIHFNYRIKRGSEYHNNEFWLDLAEKRRNLYSDEDTSRILEVATTNKGDQDKRIDEKRLQLKKLEQE